MTICSTTLLHSCLSSSVFWLHRRIFKWSSYELWKDLIVNIGWVLLLWWSICTILFLIWSYTLKKAENYTDLNIWTGSGLLNLRRDWSDFDNQTLASGEPNSLFFIIILCSGMVAGDYLTLYGVCNCREVDPVLNVFFSALQDYLCGTTTKVQEHCELDW